MKPEKVESHHVEDGLMELQQPRRKILPIRIPLEWILILGGFYLWFSSSSSISKSTTTVETPNALEAAEFDWFDLKPCEDIVWTDCFDGQKCARLSLPLDYMTPDGPKTEIAMRMIPATVKDSKQYKGTVLVNPGGPGESGTDFIAGFGRNLSIIVGPEFDVLGFDPRGVGATTPQAQCFDSESQYKLWSLQSSTTPLSPHPNAVSIARSQAKLLSQRCQATIGGSGEGHTNRTAAEWGPGRFVSTPSVATDMLRITEKLGQEKLQYWGFSYGSVLGQYFAAMYPDKVGRLIIDGVYDAEDYRKANWLTNLHDTDKVLASFHSFCHQAGPSKCPLYEPTESQIQTRVLQALETLKNAPIPVPFAASGPTVYEEHHLHSKLFRALYTPLQAFSKVAEAILAVEQRNQTALQGIVESGSLSYKCNCKPADAPWLLRTEALQAIACSDADPLSDEPGEFEAYLQKLNATSAFGARAREWAQIRLSCLEWNIKAKWRFQGALSADNTSFPILIVQPTNDPVCPISDARRVRARYAGAGFLEQRSYGHCSLSSPSLCTAKHVRAYFRDGVLPEEGTVCEVDALPFVGEVGAKAYGDDGLRELDEAWRALGNAVPGFPL